VFVGGEFGGLGGEELLEGFLLFFVLFHVLCIGCDELGWVDARHGGVSADAQVFVFFAQLVDFGLQVFDLLLPSVRVAFLEGRDLGFVLALV